MVFALAWGWCVIYINRTCLYPLLPVIADALGISSAQSGLLSGMYFALYVLFQVPSGILMARFGTRRCMLTGYACAGAALLGIGLWGNGYALLLCFLAVQGIGDSFYYAAAQTVIAVHARPERRALYSALLGVGMSAGVLLGLGLSHPLYSLLGGYRLPFMVFGAVTVVTAFILAIFVPNVQAEVQQTASCLSLFKDRDIWKIGLAMFCLMYGFWVTLNWGPTFLRLERGIVSGQAGLYSGLVALGAMPGGVMWSRLSDRWGRKKVLLLALALSALFLFAVAGMRSVPLIMLALVAFGACNNAAVVPVSVVWVSSLAVVRYPGNTSVAIAFFNCLTVLSAVIAPVVSGLIRDISGGLSGALFLGAAVILVGPLLLWKVSENNLLTDDLSI